MATSTYKPLFNRRYLTALMWIIPIVILILHHTSREHPPTPLTISRHADPDHWRLSYDALPDYQLTALKPMLPGWNLAHTLRRADEINSLEHWLAEEMSVNQLSEFGWHASINTLSSAIQLRLSMNQAPTNEQITWLATGLSLLPQTELDDKQRLIATWQLDQRQAENRLLAEFESWLFSEADASQDWTLLLSGPQLSINEATSALTASSINSLARAKVISEEAHVKEIHHLLAWQVPLSEDAADLAKHRISINAIQRALDSIPNRPDYRFIWNPLPPKSYLLIITQGQIDQKLDDRLVDLLLGANSDSLLTDVVEQAIEQYQPANATAMNAIDWFELSALLNFPVNSDLIYMDTIKQLTHDDIREHLATMLNSQHQLHITLQPY